MNTLKKQDKENELRFTLSYYLGWSGRQINQLFESLNTKTNMKNYWLQKKANKEKDKEYNSKLDEIARFITKYISNRKSGKQGMI